MDIPAKNPAGLPVPSCLNRITPDEQTVYATAHLFRAIASSEGHNTHNKNPIWPIQVPMQESAGLTQLAYISLRHST